MSTRGAYGFRLENKDILAYNHCDSYPEGLGRAFVRDVKALLKTHGMESLKDKVKAMRQVDSNTGSANDADIEAFRDLADLSVSTRNLREWYVLLRGMQGQAAIAVERGIWLLDNAFIHDGLDCEHAYVANLDTMELEVYKGGHKNRETLQGRYCKGSTYPDEFYGTTLKKTHSLLKMPAKP